MKCASTFGQSLSRVETPPFNDRERNSDTCVVFSMCSFFKLKIRGNLKLEKPADFSAALPARRLCDTSLIAGAAHEMLSGQTRVLSHRGYSDNCQLFPVQITTILHALSSQLSVSVTLIHDVENALQAGYVALKTAGVCRGVACGVCVGGGGGGGGGNTPPFLLN